MKVKSLDKKWKEFLYAFTGFGPNFLMVLMGAFFTDAINPAALAEGSPQAIMGSVCFILPAIFPILYTISKAFDGIIDIPFAHITDTLSTKWGRRRPAIAICAIPMTVSFAMCWLPIMGPDKANFQTWNTVWFIFWALIFFATYTMCLIAFYGSISTTCSDEPQRARVSSYKSFFDTISYCLVYALVPLLLDVFNEVNPNFTIQTMVWCCLPLMATIIIPLFMIKEGAKYGYPENDGIREEKVGIWKSIKLTFGNKVFVRWLAVNCCTFFGMQMFLVGMNAMINGGMNMNGGEMAILNTCAFAPVPVMLYLFNKLKAKKGVRFTYQTCLIAFAIAILCFFFGSVFITGGDKTLQFIIGCTGSVMGSWAIGAFFMMSVLAATQISNVEEKITGVSHSAMYFAGNAVVTSVAGAISSGLIYEYIKMLFFNKSTGEVIWLKVEEIPANVTMQDHAANVLGGVFNQNVFNLGTLIVPFVVAACCLIGFGICFTLPKDFSLKEIAIAYKKHYPNLDISHLVTAEEELATKEKGEVLFVQIGLSILSGFIFGFIWLGFLLKSLKEFFGKKVIGKYFLYALVPFAGAICLAKEAEKLQAYAAKQGVEVKTHKALHIVFGIIFPIAPLNVVSLALLQHNVNKLYKKQFDEQVAALHTQQLSQANADDFADAGEVVI